MWPKLAGLAVVEVALLAALSSPFPSHAVMYDPADTARVHEFQMQWSAVMGLLFIGVVLSLFVIPWLAYRVVRQHRKAGSNQA